MDIAFNYFLTTFGIPLASSTIDFALVRPLTNAITSEAGMLSLSILSSSIKLSTLAATSGVKLMFNNPLASFIIISVGSSCYVLYRVGDYVGTNLGLYEEALEITEESNKDAYSKINQTFNIIYNDKQSTPVLNTAGYITNATPTPTITPSGQSVEELINLFSTKYVIIPKTSMSYSSFVKGSVGINIPQLIVASIEDAAITKGNMKSALVAAGSVGLSNLVPSYTTGMWGSGTEKYLVEPIIAGILYAIGSNYIKSADKEGSMIKKFSKGFIIGASSAAVAGSIMSSTVANTRAPSQYSPSSGLRAGAGTTSANVPTSYPSVVVA